MLPRFRFVLAAALIAALPWFLLGGGILPNSPASPTSELGRQSAAMNLSASDLRDAHHMHILAYVRRSRELEKLRDLSDWVAAPAGTEEPPSPLPPEQARVSQPETPSVATPEAPAEAGMTQTASLPPDPVAPEPPRAVEEPPSPAPSENAQQQPVDEQPTAQSVQPAQANIEPTMVSNIRPGFRPPLPKARPIGEVQQIVKRRAARAMRTRYTSRPQDFPFGIPPTTQGGTRPAATYGRP